MAMYIFPLLLTDCLIDCPGSYYHDVIDRFSLALERLYTEHRKLNILPGVQFDV